MAVYNNPALGQAFGNLAAAFAPPSGSDLAGYANAAATREQAQRLQEFYQKSIDPNTSWEMIDRMGLGTGGWNPAQSFEGLDRNNATQRYATDVGARTTLDQQRLSDEAAMARQMALPISVNENQTVFLPRQTQEATGLVDTIMGQSSVGQGETIMRPDGAVIEGSQAPLSETQWQAAQNDRLLGTGQLTDDMIIDTIVGQRTPVEAVGPDGSPIFMSPGAAVREGAGVAQTGSPGTIRMYRTSDGQEGRTVDGLHDMVTGDPIPANARVGTISDTSDTFGSSEIGTVRQDILGRRAGLTSMINQVASIDEMLAGADSAQAVGIVGGASRVINDLATQAGAVFQATGITAPAELRNVQMYQDTFRTMGVQNAELQSALLDLAYATAQSREPGRLTEADIDRALRTIGANLQDPLAMRQVLRGAVDRATTDYRAQEGTMIDAYGDALNLQPAQFPELAPLGAPSGGPTAGPTPPAPPQPPQPPAPPTGGQSQLPDYTQYDTLPSGARYRDPDGNIREKS